MSSQSTANEPPITKTNRSVPTSGASPLSFFFNESSVKSGSEGLARRTFLGFFLFVERDELFAEPLEQRSRRECRDA